MHGPAFIYYELNEYGLTTVGSRGANILSIVFIGTILGHSLFHGLRKGNKQYKIKSYKVWNESKWIIKSFNVSLLLFFVLLSYIIIIGGLFFQNGITALWSVATMNLSPELIKEIRLNESGVSGWLKSPFLYLTNGFGRFIAFLFFAYVVTEKKSIIFKIASYTLIFLLLLSCATDITKSNALIFLVQFVFLILLIRGVTISLKKQVIFFLIFLGLIIPIYFLLTVIDNVNVALEEIVFRFTNEPNRVFHEYISYWPDFEGFKYGMNIRQIHSLLSNEKFIPAAQILSGGIGNWNVMFAGDAWVDFGYLGVIITSVLVGFYLNLMDSYCFKEKSIFQVSLFAALIYPAINLVSNSLQTNFFLYGLLSFPAIAFLLKIRLKKAV